MLSACGRTRTNQLVPGKQLLNFFLLIGNWKKKHCLKVLNIKIAIHTEIKYNLCATNILLKV